MQLVEIKTAVTRRPFSTTLREGLAERPWLPVLVLVVLAAALRFHHLDGQLWLDEISALRGYRKPFLETLTTFPPFFPNPLYELMAHAGLLLFGENAFAIRLPAALFGVAGVVVFYHLVRRVAGPGEASFAGALLAVSYHHVFFSQDARGYTTYLFFALLAIDRLLALLDRMSWRTACAYAAAVALATYAHPFGLFVLAGHSVVAFLVVSFGRRSGRTEGPTPREILGAVSMGGLAILILFAPLVADAIAYALTESRTAGHGPRLLEVLPELIEGLTQAFGGWPVLVAAASIGVAGGLDWLRREPLVVYLLAAPVVVSALAMIVLGAGIHPRYFLLALPLGYLAGARGIMLVVRRLSDGVFHASPDASIVIQTVAGVAAVAAACVPLAGYYAVPKQDYLGALREVRALATNGDRVVAATLAGFAYQYYYEPEMEIISEPAELDSEEMRGRRVWLITTLERAMLGGDPELVRSIHREFERVRYLPGSVGDGAMRIYVREALR